MGFGFSTLIFLFGSLLLLQSSEGHMKHEDHGNHLQFKFNQDENSGKNSDDHHPLDPAFNVFFHYNDLKPGNKLLIHFPTKDPSSSPHLLSRDESDSIPFTSSKLQHILQLFSFPEGSKQALAIQDTLHHCEYPPIKGETKFCATSLEFMLDSIKNIFGLNSNFKLLTTNYLSDSITPLQKYTISETPVRISAKKIVACHTLPYPYAVFYCHGQKSDNVLYKVLLKGEDGGRVEAAAICHMDTSEWDPDHLAFRVLGTSPGAEPVCHFFPADNLVWIPVS